MPPVPEPERVSPATRPPVERAADELPEVEIVAVRFHRWRALKWCVSLQQPDTGRVLSQRTATFDEALALARQWSLDYWAQRYGFQEILDDTARVPRPTAPPWSVPRTESAPRHDTPLPNTVPAARPGRRSRGKTAKDSTTIR